MHPRRPGSPMPPKSGGFLETKPSYEFPSRTLEVYAKQKHPNNDSREKRKDDANSKHMPKDDYKVKRRDDQTSSKHKTKGDFVDVDLLSNYSPCATGDLLNTAFIAYARSSNKRRSSKHDVKSQSHDPSLHQVPQGTSTEPYPKPSSSRREPTVLDPGPSEAETVVLVEPDPVATETEVNVHQDVLQTPGVARTRSFWRSYRRFYRRCWRALRNVWAIPFWVLLMALPISSGFMGARYLDECALNPSIPSLLFMMGVTGVILITLRVMTILLMAVCGSVGDEAHLFSVTAVTAILNFVLYITEIMSFWRFNPSFDEISPKYCNPTLYIYAFYMNCVTLVLVSLLIITRLPICVMACRRRDSI